MNENNLNNLLKYCNGYVSLTREKSLTAKNKHVVDMSKEHFNLFDFLSTDTTKGRPVILSTLNSYEPNTVTDELREKFTNEKNIAISINDIYNRCKNNEFMRQTVLDFGFIGLDILVDSGDEDEEEKLEANSDVNDPTTVDENGQISKDLIKHNSAHIESDKNPASPHFKKVKFPLFSLIVRVDKRIATVETGEAGKYLLYPADTEVQANVRGFNQILGEDLCDQLIEDISQFEINGSLSLPLARTSIFHEIWKHVKEKLKLKNINFDDSSFSLDDMRIALRPRTNYFLSEDLQKMSKKSEEELEDTALLSLVSGENLNIESDLPSAENIYFPLPYDVFQVQVLTIIGNRAAIMEGPPGTGKSETIANLLCHFAATGKKVLFVSQKGQAIKVVKDKLEKLELKYLFGYFPNPGSAQLNENDMASGIGSQLDKLDAYLRVLKDANAKQKTSKLPPDDLKLKLKASTEEIEILKRSLTEQVDVQRRYYRLMQELKKLNPFHIEISKPSMFSEHFSPSIYVQMNYAIKSIDKLTHDIRRYEKTEDKVRFDKLFNALDWQEKKYTILLRCIKEDIAQNGYDGKIRIVRFFKNAFNSRRLRHVLSELPQAMLNYIDYYLKSESSRDQVVMKIEALHEYALHHEDKNTCDCLNKSLISMLSNCGLTLSEFKLVDEVIKNTGDIDVVKQNILRFHEIKGELNSLSAENDPNVTAKELQKARTDRTECVIQCLRCLIDNNILEKMRNDRDLRKTVVSLAKKYRKSRRAFRTFDDLRKDPAMFNKILDIIPMWIMELEDASRILPLVGGLFDYLIIDESSECNIAYALPSMYRARKVLIVGDCEQMRDKTILFKTNRSLDDLASRFCIPEELQIKRTGSAVQSLLDIAISQAFKSITLRNHYRSPAELIGFSNKYFYEPHEKELFPINNRYLTYADTNRIMMVHPVNAKHNRAQISLDNDKVNIDEAEAILSFYQDLRNDDRYRDKSIGILTFFNDQANCIREKFEEKGFRESVHNYKVSIIEGIQGDEKDIVIYSFVIYSPEQKKRYVYLAGEEGDILQDINKGRINVAFTRARYQVHCFVSMDIQEFPDKIWIKKVLEYVNEHGLIKWNNTAVKPYESSFEADVFSRIKEKLSLVYEVHSQVMVSGFMFAVVLQNTKNAKSLAVECDGPTSFTDSIDEKYKMFLENDGERLAILQSAGWTFYRIKYSDWMEGKLDWSSIFRDIVALLD